MTGDKSTNTICNQFSRIEEEATIDLPMEIMKVYNNEIKVIKYLNILSSHKFNI